MADLPTDRSHRDRIRQRAGHRRKQYVQAMPEIERVLRVTRVIVSDAAMTGFNHADGDWAERLYANQASLSAALAKLDAIRRGEAGQ